MSAETISYNVYRVRFTQSGSNPDHEGIALVPAQLSDQGAGRFYHVKGDVGLGMSYECRKGYRFSASRSYKGSELQFQIAKSDLGRFEAIAENTTAPHDPRVLTERDPDPPAKDCSTWVEELLGAARAELS